MAKFSELVEVTVKIVAPGPKSEYKPFKVVKISNNLEEYPECKKDTDDHPNLIEHVNDEMDIFIIDNDGGWCRADDFFYNENIKAFLAEVVI